MKPTKELRMVMWTIALVISAWAVSSWDIAPPDVAREVEGFIAYSAGPTLIQPRGENE